MKTVDKNSPNSSKIPSGTSAPTLQTTLNPYPHVLKSNIMGRQGQRCRIIRCTGLLAQVEFEDGYRNVISRAYLRRKE